MKCKTENCLNEASKGRRVCGKCRTKKYREKYPSRYWYDTLKMNAKRRGKQFDLTLEQFIEFCKKTEYDKNKGKTAMSLSVDRIDSNNGYSINNIRAITLSDNTKVMLNPEHEIKEVCPF